MTEYGSDSNYTVLMDGPFAGGGGGSDPYPIGGSFIIRIPELRRGKRFAVIGPVQSVLANYYNISVGPSGADGIFGADTEKAVKQFQKENIQ